MTPGYATPQLVNETLVELRFDPPRFIVDVGSPALGEPGFQALLLPGPSHRTAATSTSWIPLRAFVADNYDELTIADGWVIYEFAALTQHVPQPATRISGAARRADRQPRQPPRSAEGEGPAPRGS